MGLYDVILKLLEAIFGKRPVSQNIAMPTDHPGQVEVPHAESVAVVQSTPATVTQTGQAGTQKVTFANPLPTTAKDEAQKLFDTLFNTELTEDPYGNKNFEVNTIHPDFSKYVPANVAYAAQETTKAIQRLATQKAYVVAQSYMYVALSAQWLKISQKLIAEAGTTTATSGEVGNLPNAGGFIMHADVHELLRQTIWADRNYVEGIIARIGTSDDGIRYFLNALAEDDCEFIQKTDVNKAG